MGSHALAEDLTSETFLRALRRIDSFTYTGKDIGAWFTTIARNLVTDHVKSSRFKLEVSTADMLDADRSRDDGIETAGARAAAGRRAARRGAPAQAGAAGVHRAAVPAGPVGRRDRRASWAGTEGAVKQLQLRAVRALAKLLPEPTRDDAAAP